MKSFLLNTYQLPSIHNSSDTDFSNSHVLNRNNKDESATYFCNSITLLCVRPYYISTTRNYEYCLTAAFG